MNGQTVKKLGEEKTESNSRDKKSMDINESLDSSGIESNEDDDEMAKRKNAVMEQVFQIPLIVEQIILQIQNLNDLKQCRLVNSTWMETTTKVMLKTNSASVVLKLHKRTNKYGKFTRWRMNHYYGLIHLIFQADYKNVEDADDWPSLKEIMDKSTQFPCSTFAIHKGNLSDPKMEDFFKVFGNSIKELKLNGVHAKSVEFGVLSALNFSNLEALYMENCFIEWSPEDISFELPKLKLLNLDKISPISPFGGPFKILATLIAPNLQVIRGFYLSRDFKAVANAGKIHCIKELNFRLGALDDLTKLEMVIRVGPQLQTLNIRHGRLGHSFDRLDYDAQSKWMKLIQELLDLSKNTLKSFSFEGIEFVFKNLNFPQFPQLRDIQMKIWRAVQEERESHSYASLRDNIFPNLQFIKPFDLSADTQQVLRAGKIHCVKELRFRLGELELEHLRLFLSACPQLETLEICPSLSLNTTDSDWGREFIGLLEQVLELSKDTLKNFKFDGVGVALQDMKFPKLSQLKYLKVTGYRLRIFPRGINLNETFPTLEILDLDKCTDLDSKESFDRSFPPDGFIGNLTAVKTLICCHWFEATTKRNLRMICPNAKLFYVK